MTDPLLVGISGATGIIYGIEILRALRQLGQPAHLILSEMGLRTMTLETDIHPDEVRSLADVVYGNKDLAAAVSSGSYHTRGMIIAPCSVKTLSGIANCFSYNLLIRAADVTLKERRPLVLVFRETPLHLGHLRLMQQATEMGGIILPPVPAFYSKPQTIAELVQQTVGRALDQVGIKHNLIERWRGARASASAVEPEATKEDDPDVV